MGSMTKTAAEHYGYTTEEVNSIVDHRALLILHDATEFRKLQVAKAKQEKDLKNPDTAKRKVLIRPTGNSKTAPSAARKLDIENLNRARRTGKADDVASLLIVRKGAKG